MANLTPNEWAAVETYFDGDRQFYENFRASCVLQFNDDLSQGDAACMVRDAAVLRRTAHSLKSVLLTLGYAELSALAHRVESAALGRPWEEALAAWLGLRQQIVRTFELSIR
jgi:HPt (histidine-containing phosphotransfer) domain-containing protein